MTNPIDRFNRQVSYAISEFQEHPSDTAAFSIRVTKLLSEIPSSITTKEQSSLLSRSLQDLSDTCQTLELTPITKRISNLQIEMTLNTWALAGEPNENRAIAKKRILAFLHSPTGSSLHLSRLTLTDLPDIFNHPSFSSRLRRLDLSYTQLTSLPESFGNLTTLRDLNLHATRLASLPESLGSLTALRDLNLRETRLASLPESLGSLTALRDLNLRETRLTSLPESFSSLTALRRLDLLRTQLTSLPESFGSLTALRDLSLSGTPLDSLPESFGSLTALRDLDLSGTPLASLPESFGNLTALRDLSLINNTTLTSLPESFGNLIALQTLYLSFTSLESLPESFGGLIALQSLNLNYTTLTSLPESFGSLTDLQVLDLTNTPLTSLPSTITSLSHDLHINISTLPLSEEIRSRLQATTQVPGYHGPAFFYSMDHVERRVEDRRSTVELVRDLYQELGEAPLTLSKELEESPQLRAWLSRLSYMADYKAGGENKKTLLQNILSYLRLANENSEFRGAFLAVINGAADTCGDRVALSILQIGIAYKVHTTDLSRPRDLAHLLLRGVYAISLLEDVARAKVETLRFVDEIEVYLGYPLKLKEALDLPIDVKEMLHFRCSALTDTDLSNAESFVWGQLDNPDTCHQFLIHHETWLKCLEQNYSTEFRALGAAKAADFRIDALVDYTKIQADYEKGLIALTKRALGVIDDTREASELISPPLKKIKR